MSQPHHTPPAILLMGPTASGKTARRGGDSSTTLPCEIISVDSAQVYQGHGHRHRQAGCRNSRARAASPDRSSSSRTSPIPRRGSAMTRSRLMREITERGNIPLLVGGTMLYFQGAGRRPERSARSRSRRSGCIIDTMARGHGLAGAARGTRATSIRKPRRGWSPTTRSASSARWRSTTSPASRCRNCCKKPKYVYFPYTPINIALLPSDRAVLHQRIAQRFDEMLEAGTDRRSCARCAKNTRSSSTMPSMRCVGYRQAWQYLDGEFGLDRTARERHRRHAPARQTPAHVVKIDEGRDRIRLSGRRRGGPGAGFSAAGTGAMARRREVNIIRCLYCIFYRSRPGIICVWRAASVWRQRARAPASPAPGTA